MGVDLTVGDRVYVHGRGRTMTVEDIILPGGKHITSINWGDVNSFVELKLTDELTTTGDKVSIW